MDAIEAVLLLRGDAAGAMRAIGEVEGGLGNLQKESAFSLGSIVSGLAKANVAAGLAIGAVSTWAVKGAMDFDAAMMRVHTLAGVTLEQLPHLSDAILKMAPEVAQGPMALADALYHVESLAIAGADPLEVLREAAKGATMSHANLTDVVNALGSILKANIPGVHGAADAMAQLNGIVGSGNMTFQGFADSMNSGLAAVAGAFKINIKDMGAAMAYMTDLSGGSASVAAQRLRTMIPMMAAPAKQATALLTDVLGVPAAEAPGQVSAMEEMLHLAGVNYTQLALDMQKPNGVITAFKDLKEHMDKAHVSPDEQTALLSRVFGGSRSMTAPMTLFSNLDGVQQKYDQINEIANRYPQNWADTMGTLAFKVQSAKDGFEAMRTSIGEKLEPTAKILLNIFVMNVIPALESLATWIGTNVPKAVQAAVGWFEQHQQGIKDFTGDIKTLVTDGLTAATVAFGLLATAVGWGLDHWDLLRPILIGLAGAFAIDKTITAVSAALDVFSLAISGAGAAGALAAGGAEGLGGLLFDIQNSHVAGAAGSLKGAIVDMAETGYIKFLYLKDGVGKVTSAVADAITSFASMTKSAIKEGALTAGAWIKSAAETAAGWVKTAAVTVASWVATAAKAVVHAAAVTAAWAWAAFTSRAGWIDTAAVTVASWVVTAAQAVVHAAAVAAAWAWEKLTYLAGLVEKGVATAAHYIEVAAGAVASAAATAAAWFAEKVAFLAGLVAKGVAWAAGMVTMGAQAVAGAAVSAAAWLAEKVAFVVGMAVKLAVAIPGYLALAAAAVASAAVAAAAWLLSILPFVLIGLAVAGLVYLVVTHFSQIKAFIGQVVGDVVQFFKDHWVLLLSLIIGPVALAVKWVVDHFQQIKDGASTVLKDVVGFFSDLPDNISKALGDVTKWLVQKGKDLIQGMINGIQSMGGAAAAAVKNTVPGGNLIVGGVQAINPFGALSRAAGSDWLFKPEFAVIGDNPRGERVQTKDQYDAEMAAMAKGGHTYVTVNQPTSNVDVIRSISNANHIARQAQRFTPARQWPATRATC